MENNKDFYNISFNIIINNVENSRKMIVILENMYFLGLLSSADLFSLREQARAYNEYVLEIGF